MLHTGKSAVTDDVLQSYDLDLYTTRARPLAFLVNRIVCLDAFTSIKMSKRGFTRATSRVDTIYYGVLPSWTSVYTGGSPPLTVSHYTKITFSNHVI